MTEDENSDGLVRDGEEWEQLERMAGHDPEALPIPPDIAERIEAWEEETGMGPVFEAIEARMARTGESVILEEKMESSSFSSPHGPRRQETPDED